MKIANHVPIKNSIATRLLKIVFSLYLVIAIGVTLGHMIMEYRYQKNNIRQDLQDIQKTFERGLALDVWEMDQESLYSTIEGILKIPVIVGVKIQNAKGLEIAMGGTISKNGLVGNVGPHVNLLGVKQKEYTLHGDKMKDLELFKHQFPIIYTYKKETKQMGIATIYSSTSIVFKRVKLSFLLLIINAILKTIALWLIFLWVSTFLLRKPLGILTKAATNISLKNLKSFSVDTKIGGRNEIKILEEAITVMVADLHKSVLKREKIAGSLVESEEKYRALVENAPDLRYRTDMEGTITFISQSVHHLTGYSVKETIGTKTSNQYVDPENQIDFMRKLMKKGSLENYLVELKRKDKTTWWASTNASLIRDQDGDPISIEGVSRDVTERRMADLSFQSLVEVTAGHTGQELFDTTVNQLCTLFNCDYAIIGELQNAATKIQTLSIAADGKINDNFSYELKGTPCYHATQKGYCVYNENVTKQFPEDLGLIDMEAQGYVGIPIKGANKEILGVLCAISRKKLELPERAEDIFNILESRLSAEIERIRVYDEKTQLESQLQQSQKMEAIGTLAGGIAHDFNNILGGMLGFSELIQEDLKEINCSQETHKSLEYVIKGGMRAKDLVAQILAYSRSDQENLHPICVALIAEEITQLLRASLPATIEIKKAFFSKSMVLADATKLHQIFMNLCTNAGYAMKEKGGILEISLNDVFLDDKAISKPKNIASGNFLHISVKDTGHGMNKEIISKITDPFFTTKPKKKGTGMGLWVVHEIIKNMEGFIQISSKPGSGSTFEIFLPLYSEITKPAITPFEKEILRGSENILFIDDEKSLTQLAKTSLSNLGYNVTTFNSSIEALAYFKQNFEKCDIVITDMTMPEMTGDVLNSQIRSIKPDAHILLCTGFSENIDEKRWAINFDAVLKKPVLLSDMANAIRKSLDGKKEN